MLIYDIHSMDVNTRQTDTLLILTNIVANQALRSSHLIPFGCLQPAAAAARELVVAFKLW